MEESSCFFQICNSKSVGQNSYTYLNAHLKQSGIPINTLKTFTDIPFQAISFANASLRGIDVIKCPYGHCEDLMNNLGKAGLFMGKAGLFMVDKLDMSRGYGENSLFNHQLVTVIDQKIKVVSTIMWGQCTNYFM